MQQKSTKIEKAKINLSSNEIKELKKISSKLKKLDKQTSSCMFYIR